MASSTAYARLSASFGFGQSKLLPQILAHLMSEPEAETMLLLPGTAGALAQASGRPHDEVAAELDALFLRGLVFVGELEPTGPLYQLVDAGRFMDSVLFDPQADRFGLGFYLLWSQFAHQELWPAMGNVPWNFRVLPVGEAVECGSRVMACEEAEQIVSRARRIAVQQCPCRKRERRCDNPLEVCLSLDTLADYVLYRRAGREIDAQEARTILRRCAELGLVHQTVNTDQVDVICNCCGCCCGVLTPLLAYGMGEVTSRSRFRAVVDPERCTGCLECVGSCLFGALVEAEGRVLARPERCFGCGLCAVHCPLGGIALTEVRGTAHIPTGTPGFALSRLPARE